MQEIQTTSEYFYFKPLWEKKGNTDQLFPACSDFVTGYPNQSYVNIWLLIPIPKFEELHPEKESPQPELGTQDIGYMGRNRKPQKPACGTVSCQK